MRRGELGKGPDIPFMIEYSKVRKISFGAEVWADHSHMSGFFGCCVG